MVMVALLSLLVSLGLTSSAAFSGANFRSRDVGLATARTLQMGLEFMSHYEEIQLGTDHRMSIFDITDQIEAIVATSSCKEGTVTVLSKHSTVSVSINEMEG